MITRRSIMAFLGLAPAIPVFAKPMISDDVLPLLGNFRSMMRSVTEVRPDLSDRDLPAHLKKLTREFNPRLGDLGRAAKIQSLEEIIQIKNEIKLYGFEPYLVPGLVGPASQFLPIYAASGAPAYGVWFGFVRDHAGKHEAISFETTPAEVKQAGYRTLNEAINS